MLFAAYRAVIEIRGGPGVADSALPVRLNELKPLGNDELASAAGDPAILNGVLQVKQRADILAIVRFIDKHGAAFHQVAVAFERQIHHSVEQSMAGAEKRGHGWPARLIFVEANPLVALQHRLHAADLVVALADRSGDAGDLVIAGLAPVDLPARMAEGFEEEAFDVMRLKPSGLCSLHHFADIGDPRGRHVIADECPLGQQIEQTLLIYRGIDLFEQPCLDLGLFAIADRLDEQIAQLGSQEQGASFFTVSKRKGTPASFRLKTARSTISR
jgi:hypothetical protein